MKSKPTTLPDCPFSIRIDKGPGISPDWETINQNKIHIAVSVRVDEFNRIYMRLFEREGEVLFDKDHSIIYKIFNPN